MTVSSELSSCIAEKFSNSDLVVGFFHVQRKSDGHWATPHLDLPLILNDEALDGSMLLSHGKNENYRQRLGV